MIRNFRSPQRPKKNTLVIGRQNVINALNEGVALDRIYLDGKAIGNDVQEIKRLAAKAGVPLNYVPIAKINGFNVTDHEGCVAQIAKVIYQDLQQMISFVTDQGETPLFLILDGITDIRNIGGIARTAYCCGVHALIIPDKGVGALNEEALLTSAGALEKIAVCRVNSLMKAVDDLHMNGIKVVATEMTAEKSIGEFAFTEPVAIVMGSEDKGIYPALLKVCDESLRIPMTGDFESLNVSVATGMVLYETMRQRQAG
ncbi:MAG: 23S rRNA (guanosine(2251)-2'-O)-methyltransferase RlmB [Chitinophagaceae bacterium]